MVQYILIDVWTSVSDFTLHCAYRICRHITAEQVIHHAEINPVTDVTIYDDICDNRDLNIYLSWDPKDQ